MKRALIALAAFGLPLALAACATPTPYQAVGADQPYGYMETRLETERYRLSFSGNSLTDRETVENYLLFRAAELTLETGFDHFLVVARDTETRTRIQSVGSPRFGASLSYYHPRIGWRPYYDPFFNDITLREVTRYEAVAEIVMGRGDKPAGNENAYDARAVQMNLSGRIVRPPAG